MSSEMNGGKRVETLSENIARDMAEGRFPQRSYPKMVDDHGDVWDRILNDEDLRNVRAKLSISELRAIIKHASEASHSLLTPSEAFSSWLNAGPKLALAAGCHVGIKVTELPTGGRIDE